MRTSSHETVGITFRPQLTFIHMDTPDRRPQGQASGAAPMVQLFELCDASGTPVTTKRFPQNHFITHKIHLFILCAQWRCGAWPWPLPLPPRPGPQLRPGAPGLGCAVGNSELLYT